MKKKGLVQKANPAISRRFPLIWATLAGLPCTSVAETFEGTEIGNNLYLDIFPNGHIAVVGDNWGTLATRFRMFQQDGTPSCPIIPLNSIPPATFNIRPAIAVTGNNSLVAVWDQNSDIFGQRFTVTGNTLGSPFKIDARDASENSPVIAANSSGQFVVAWTYNSSGTSYTRLRHFNEDGSPRHEDSSFIGISNPSGIQLMLNNDRRANVVWSSSDSWEDRSYISGSHLRDDGYTLRSFTVDRTEPGDGSHVFPPSAEADANGRFVVAWRRRDPDKNDRVLAREYDENSQPIGPIHTLSDTTVNAGDPQVAVDKNGRTIVAWTSEADGQLYYSTLLLGRTKPSSPLRLTTDIPHIRLVDLGINSSGGAAASWSAGGGISNITTFQNGESKTIDFGPDFAAWQTRNFVDPGAADSQPDADPDRDDLSNLLEYKLGFPPGYHSRLPAPVHNGASLNWTLPLNPEAANVTLSVEASTNLGASTWIPVETLIPGTNATTAIIPNSEAKAIFLRARVRELE